MQDSATQASGGVTAFSQQRARLRGADAGEVAELEALMEQMEDAEGGDVALEDDFIISATQVIISSSEPFCNCACSGVDSQHIANEGRVTITYHALGRVQMA